MNSKVDGIPAQALDSSTDHFVINTTCKSLQLNYLTLVCTDMDTLVEELLLCSDGSPNDIERLPSWRLSPALSSPMRSLRAERLR